MATTVHPDHGRLWAPDRRQSLVDAAARILASDGLDAIRIPAVAREAGVTRPVVYRFFANRQALVVAVLEDFAGELERRHRAVLRAAERIEEALPGVLEATCDLIAERGAAAWRLLGSVGPDAESDRVIRDARERAIEPWMPRMQRATGASRDEAVVLNHVTSAATRGALDLWVDGKLDRDEAVAHSLRAVTAILAAFRAAR